MRALLAALLVTTALPAAADTLTATSKITAVTVYPDGAKITRAVRFDAPGAGPHELLVTDLPAATEPDLLRLEGGEGLVFGAFSLRADRLPPREEPQTEAQRTATAGLEAAQATERQALAEVEAIQSRIQAANARATFLSSFSGGLPDTATPESLKAMALMIGSETLAAAEDAATAKAALWAAQKSLLDAQEAKGKAQAALDSLPSRDSAYTALAVAIEAPAAGATSLTVTHYISNAGWRPFYDLYLTRKDSAKLTIDRSVLVTQYTGEDWSDVALTLSSSRPSEQAAPSTLWPWLRQIVKDEPVAMASAAKRSISGNAEADMLYELAPAPAPVTSTMAIEGDTVVYHYPRPVNVASGVEDLRLSLDRLEVAPKVLAVAVPSRDKTAFVTAEFTNTSPEPLLPGDALLFREGVLVGSSQLALIASGAESEIAFGALDTVQLTRDMPSRDSGQSGIFTTSNEMVEQAVLKIKNTGSESWPLRVIDQLPYSEQQDLVVKPQLTPAPTLTDLDGQRGILAWEFDLPAGETQEISLGYSLSWPEGMILR